MISEGADPYLKVSKLKKYRESIEEEIPSNNLRGGARTK